MLHKAAGVLAIVAIGVLAAASPALAAGRFTLFGAATRVHPGHNSHTAVQLTSVGTSFGGIDFKIPTGLTFGSINALSTDFKFTQGSCGGGAPRFQVNVDGKNAFVYVGPPPNYTGCPMNVWMTSGNLVGPSSFVDTSQLPGGTFYDTFASAQAKYGSDVVTGIQLVTDGGWAVGGTQVVLVDNVVIDSRTFTFEGRHQGDDNQGHDNEGQDENDD